MEHTDQVAQLPVLHGLDVLEQAVSLLLVQLLRVREPILLFHLIPNPRGPEGAAIDHRPQHRPPPRLIYAHLTRLVCKYVLLLLPLLLIHYYRF